MPQKIIVILGPTASGKSELAVKLAKKFNGEIISADSRQVYHGMDIGTGKITPDTKNSSNFSTGHGKKKYIFTHKGIPHYCIDVASPKKRFTVAQYRELALKAINKIFRKGKTPILCGGTAFYIQAVVDGIVIPEVKPDWKLRRELEKKTAQELFAKLKKIDPKRAKTIERENKRRLIRALEVVIKTKRPVPVFQKKPLPYPVLMIGIKKEEKELEKLIKKRFLNWLKQGFLKEALKLKNPPSGQGLSWQRIEEFGVHYRATARYLQGKINEEEFIEKSLIELQNYAKRQMTWWKADKRIHWVKNIREAEKLAESFLS